MPGMPRGRIARRRGRYEVHQARRRGQALAILVLAGGVLATLFGCVELLVGERDGTSLVPARPLGAAPWK